MKSPREVAEHAARIMRQIIEQGREAMPICYAHTTDDKMMLVGFDMPDEHSKDVAAQAMRVLAKKPDVDYVVFLTDAWMATIDMKEAGDVDMSGNVRSMPGRKESIVATIFGRGRATEMGYWVYGRINGKPAFSEKMVWAEGGQLSGRFVPNSRDPRKQA